MLTSAQDGRPTAGMTARMRQTANAITTGVGISQDQEQQSRQMAANNKAPKPYVAPPQHHGWSWGKIAAVAAVVVVVVAVVVVVVVAPELLLPLAAIAGAEMAEGGGAAAFEAEAAAETEAAAEAEAGAGGEGAAIIDSGKYDYMFGKVASNSHNAARSAQNAAQLARIGVYDNAEGRALLQSHFDGVVRDDSNVIRTYSDQYGEYQVRDSLFSGPGGFLHLESTWQITDNGLRLTTVIPRGGQ